MPEKTLGMTTRVSFLTIFVGVVLLLFTITAAASFDWQTADQGQQIFQQKCASCHTVGGGILVGPDLQGVTGKRERVWLQEFILDPNSKFDSGDPIALQLLQEFNNIRMPNMALTAVDVESVLLFLESSSGTGLPTALPAAGVGGAAAGQHLFMGQTQLANGGTACNACHSISGSGFLDGGTLGPDLTQVYTRYGEPGLLAAISAINFPTMLGIFGTKPLTPQEAADLVAYFKQTNAQPAPVGNKTGLYLAIAVGLAVVLFVILLIFWPRQRQSISEKLRAGKL
jgi:mono/diheme cytochrome c family protein